MTTKELYFCEFLARGLSATKSYMAAFQVENRGTASVEACKKLKKPSIRAKVEELKQEHLRYIRARPGDLLLDCFSVLQSDIMNYYEQDEEGRLKLADLSSMDTKAIESIRPTKYGYAIKMRSKDKARADLAAYLGLQLNTPVVNVNVDTDTAVIKKVFGGLPEELLRSIVGNSGGE